MFHIYGMVVVTLDAISDGARLVTLPKFDPKLFLETLVREKVNVFILPVKR